MVMREISPYLLLGHLFIAGVGSACVAVLCLRCCNSGITPGTDACLPCSNKTCLNDSEHANISSYEKAFQVSINNSTGSEVEEGNDITLTCVHNLPTVNLTFEWKKDRKEVEGPKNSSELVLRNVLYSKSGVYICFVNSLCGNYESSPHNFKVKDNNVIILVICGVSALALVMIMGLVMKIKLKRDNAKHRERREQRAQRANHNPPPFEPRRS